MMAENNLSEEYKKRRVVLGDVSNQLGKRGISSISSNLGLHCGDENGKNFDKKERENLGTKYVHLNDKECSKRACLLPRPSSQSSFMKENVAMGVSRIPNEIKDPKLLGSGVGCSDIRGFRAVVEIGDESRSSCEDGNSMPICKSDSDCVEVEVICDSEGGKVGSQDEDTHVSENDYDDRGVDNLVLSQTDSVDCARFPEAKECRTFELERCSGLMADGCSNFTTDVELIKSCSCSFCTKAGYIWLDLHYQDMKGRIAALKKIQKDASILVERSCRMKGTDKHGPGSSSKQSNLEHDLMVQWRSLFLHMGKIFEHEDNELEASLHSLKDLRERYKTELEVINGKAPENQ